MANTHRLAQPIELRIPYSNIDYNYGPYASKVEACSAIIKPQRLLGLTVAIKSGNGVEEYWFKEGVEDKDLVKKQEGEKIPPVDLSNYYNKDESDTRFAEFNHWHQDANEGISGFMPGWMYAEIMQLLHFRKEGVWGRYVMLTNESHIILENSFEQRFDTFYLEYTEKNSENVLISCNSFDHAVGERACLIENKAQEPIEFIYESNNLEASHSTFKSLRLNPGKSVEVIAKFYGFNVSVSHLFFDEESGEVIN